MFGEVGRRKKSLENKNSKKQMYQAIGKIIFAYTEMTKNLDRRSVEGMSLTHKMKAFGLIDFFAQLDDNRNTTG